MLIVSLEQVKLFSNVYQDDDILITSCTESAQDLVFSYLKYNPVKESKEDYITGNGISSLFLKSFPLDEAEDVLIDDVIITDYIMEKNILTIPDYTFTYLKKYKVNYTAGYEFDTTNLPLPINEIPAIITHTIIQIASLLLAEAGNIGISGKSDMNTGNRTFISYNNFDKYLSKIKSYQLKQALI